MKRHARGSTFLERGADVSVGIPRLSGDLETDGSTILDLALTDSIGLP